MWGIFMFYVSSKNNGLFGVIDTDDNVEEFYTKEKLLQIVSNLNLEIDGVDIEDDAVCIVKPIKETVRLFRQGKVHLAISTMSIENNRVGIRLRSKSTSGEMSFVDNKCINISRRGINDYSFDLGYSKSYRSGLTLDDILIVVEGFSNYNIVDSNIGGY